MYVCMYMAELCIRKLYFAVLIVLACNVILSASYVYKASNVVRV